MNTGDGSRLFSIPDVASCRRVSERTIWNDIKSGCLEAERQGGRVFVTERALANYRTAAPSETLWTVDQVAHRCNVSVRSVRRMIQSGELDIVRISPRRLLVRADQSFCVRDVDSKMLPLSVLDDRARDSLRSKRARQRRELRATARAAQRCAARAVAFLVKNRPPVLISVSAVAQLANVPRRSVYHDIRTKGIPAVSPVAGARRIGVRPLDAAAYAGGNALARVVAWALGMCRAGESEKILRKAREIALAQLTEKW